MMLKETLKTKTFWAGVLLILAGLHEAWFPDDTFVFTWGVLNAKVLSGIVTVTGRDALQKLLKSK